jgi:alpha-L-rhamnosidase
VLPISLIATLTLQQGPFAGANWLTIPRTESPIENANWIWPHHPNQPIPTTQKASVGTVRFTRVWSLKEKPAACTVWFTADNQSEVKLNGHSLGKSDRWEIIKKVDCTQFLKTGNNTFEVEATNDQGTSDQNPGGFLFASQVNYASGKQQTIISDSNWQSPDGDVVTLGNYSTAPWNKTAGETPPPIFRKTIHTAKKVTKAVARIVGLGHFDFIVNGKRQGNGILNQPWSQFDKTIYFHEFDITKALNQGDNNLAAVMGNSFYRVAQTPGRFAKGDAMPDFSNESPYLFSMVLDLTHADGTHSKIVTDKDWKWTTSPYTYSHVYGGEDYDARVVTQKQINHPVVLANAPSAELLPISWPQFKEVQTFQPTKVFEYKPGVWTYVFPQNAMAIVKIRVRGTSGQRLEITPSEVMSPEGEVQQLNLWGGHSFASYTLSGKGTEDHEWRFFYHGFQFVELKGGVPKGQPNPNGLPVVESLELVHVRTDNPEIGQFESSKPLLNQTHDLIDWAMRSNMGYVLTDCPHREKLGWLECSHLLFRTFAYRYDSQAWFHKIARDMRDIQLPDGRITTVAPDYLMLPPSSPYKFTIEWGAAGVLLPWQAYEWYGDRRFLTENYDMMKHYVDWIDAHSVDGVGPAGLGDWYDYGHGQPPGPSRFTPTQETATAMSAMCAQALVKTANALGKTEDAAIYQAMYERVRKAFQHNFYNATTKIVQNNGSCQTSNAMAICAELIPTADREASLNEIVKDLEARDYQQTPGDVGHLFFIRALAEGGRSDVLHKVYSRTGIGSYGGIIAKGLTTMPETWDAITVGSNSLNHCMLGHAMEWLYGWVLGIRQAPDSIGWNRILIAPELGSLTKAAGKTVTPHGEVSIKWWRNGDKFTAEVTVPKGASTEFVLPISGSKVTLDAQPINTKPGLFGRNTLPLTPGHHVIKVT